MLSYGVQNARPANLSAATPATVSDALRLALPSGTRIVQGHLQRPISWVRSFITRPWSIGNIEEGTLVIAGLQLATALILGGKAPETTFGFLWRFLFVPSLDGNT